jgi:hypothetical protein
MASQNPHSLAWIVQLLTRRRGLLLAICGLLAILGFRPAMQLRFDRSIESMFRADDPRLISYLETKDRFGGTESFAVAYRDPELLTPEGLRRIGRLAGQLEQVEGVTSVESLEGMPTPSAPLDRRPLSEQVEGKSLPPDVFKRELLGSRLLRGTLLGPDGQTTVILGELAPSALAQVPREVTLEAVRRIAAAHTPRAVVAGEPVLVHDVFSYMEADGTRLGIASSLLLTLVILVLFRNLRWVILPLAVVHLALIWTKAFLVASGMRLSMVSSPLVALVTVIGVATVVHITMRFREARRTRPALEALQQTGMTVGPAVFWTCLTTAAGFASLLISQITPVRSFGLMMAIGSLLVFVAAVGILPGGVLLGRRNRTGDPDQPQPKAWSERGWVGRYVLNDPRPAPGESRMTAGLETIVEGVERHPWRVALVTAGLLAFSAVGFFRLEVATDFTENYRKNSPIVESYKFLSDRMGVVASIDVLIDAPVEITGEFLSRVRALQAELERVPGVIVSLSVVDALDMIERVGVSDLIDFLESSGARKDRLWDRLARTPLDWIPVPQRLRVQVPIEMRLEAMELIESETLARFWNRDRQVMRLVVQTADRKGADAKKLLVEQIESAAKRHFPTLLFSLPFPEGPGETIADLKRELNRGRLPDAVKREFERAELPLTNLPIVSTEQQDARWSLDDLENHRHYDVRIEQGQVKVYSPARVAGAFVLLTYLVESLLADQWTTFLLAGGAIFLMMTVAFRSWRLGLAALIPNVAPILVVVGAMGWVGLKVNMATAMIASVSMGLAVDFSIHYLYRYRRERAGGASFYDALRAAHGTVGLAMVLANVALIAGFSVLVISSFIPTVHFGILVSVAMLGGLAGNLVILPLLLALLPSERNDRRVAPRPVHQAQRTQQVP